jgi:hypothetical protein
VTHAFTGSSSQAMSEVEMKKWILLLQVRSTLAMFGLIWFV